MPLKTRHIFGAVGVNPVQHCLDCTSISTTDSEEAQELLVVHGTANQLIFRLPQQSCSAHSFLALPVPRSTPTSVRVNCVRFFTNNSVICGTSDGRVLIAKRSKDLKSWSFEAECDLSKALPDLDTFRRSVLCLSIGGAPGGNRIVVAATASDSALVWEVVGDDDSWLTSGAPQVLKLPPQKRAYLETCAACIIDAEDEKKIRVVALGGTDCRVYLYACYDSDKHNYVRVASLSGHQQWVSALSFSSTTVSGCSSVTLASGSHDGKMRLWKISCDSGKVNAVLDSVLGGHDDWVTSIKWVGSSCIVTASMDRTLSLWLPERTTNVWTNSVRLWGVPGNLLGGSIFGFYSVVVSPDGSTVLAHGYTGAIHAWKLSPSLNNSDLSTDNLPVATQCALFSAGATSRATTLCWSDVRENSAPPYLLMGAEDKVVRAYAQCKHGGWAEIARPLVHGHVIRSICPVGHNHAFAVVSEEKAVRVLTAPSTFIKSLYLIHNSHDIKTEMKDIIPKVVLDDCAKRPIGAALPALSLSNRPMFEGDQGGSSTATSIPAAAMSAAGTGVDGDDESKNEGEESEDYGADVPSYPSVLHAPPFEEHLVKNTLWPESRKLFGHNAEALCVGSNVYAPTSFFVSGCSAFRPTDATVCVWRDGVPVAAPMLHENRGAIVSCCCSPDGTMFAAASVDKFSLWKINKDHTSRSCELIASLPRLFVNAPSCCKWSPDGHYIAVTGAKDGAAHILRLDVQEDGTSLLAPYGTIPPSSSEATVTAVAWTTTSNKESPLVLSVGESNGAVALWNVGEPSLKAQADTALLGMIPKEQAHNAQINALDWIKPGGDSTERYLASCGDDWITRIIAVDYI